MKKMAAIFLSVIFLGVGFVWLFFERQPPAERSESVQLQLPERQPENSQTAVMKPSLKKFPPKVHEQKKGEQKREEKERPNFTEEARVSLPRANPLDSYPRQKLVVGENLQHIKGVVAHARKDSIHGEWLYSSQGLHYYRADGERVSNVVYDPIEKRYGRLTGEFVFTGKDARMAEKMASDLGLQKNTINVGTGKVVILTSDDSHGQLEILSSKYKDLVTPDVQYALQQTGRP